MSAQPVAREILRCAHCKLNQFVSMKRDCRRCGASLDPVTPLNRRPVLVIAPRPPSVTTGQLIKRRREEIHLSQRDVANRMGCPRTYISKLEHDRCMPHQKTLVRIATALECDFCKLLGQQHRTLADVDDPGLVEFMRQVFDEVQRLTHDQLWAVCKEARRLLVQQELLSIPADSACMQLEKAL